MPIKNYTCDYCNTTLEYAGNGRPPATCGSEDCLKAKEAHLLLPIANCKMCLKPFKKGKSHPPGTMPPPRRAFSVFCSDACYKLHDKKGKVKFRASAQDTLCLRKHCTLPPQSKIAHYCSEAHLRLDFPHTTEAEAQQEPHRTCAGPGCNTIMLPDIPTLRAPNKFCSKGCRTNDYTQRTVGEYDPALIRQSAEDPHTALARTKNSYTLQSQMQHLHNAIAFAPVLDDNGKQIRVVSRKATKMRITTDEQARIERMADVIHEQASMLTWYFIANCRFPGSRALPIKCGPLVASNLMLSWPQHIMKTVTVKKGDKTVQKKVRGITAFEPRTWEDIIDYTTTHLFIKGDMDPALRLPRRQTWTFGKNEAGDHLINTMMNMHLFVFDLQGGGFKEELQPGTHLKPGTYRPSVWLPRQLGTIQERGRDIPALVPLPTSERMILMTYMLAFNWQVYIGWYAKEVFPVKLTTQPYIFLGLAERAVRDRNHGTDCLTATEECRAWLNLYVEEAYAAGLQPVTTPPSKGSRSTT